MRILITGGLGFLGGRIASYLAEEGHIIVLGSRNAISAPVWLPQAEVNQISWDDVTALESICKDVDVLIHAAGMNAQDCAADPEAALAFNGEATARLVAAACRAGVRRFIYFSTAHIYCSPLVGIITEETFPRNPHPYATSHLAGEAAVSAASQRGQIQGIILRISNAFGAPMDQNVNCWMLLVNDLCRQAVQTGRLILHSNGQQQRDFIAISNVCRIVQRFSINNTENSQLGIFNAGSGISQSVLNMAQLIQQRCAQVLQFEPELQHRKLKGIDPALPLFYKSSRPDMIGVNLDFINDAEEIDNLLRYCGSISKP